MTNQPSPMDLAIPGGNPSRSVSNSVICLGQTFPSAQIAEQPHKKLKVFRMEAIRTGFKQAWQGKDYQTIVTVAEKIPPSVLEEDDKLLMWYDQAVTRIGG